MCDGCVQLLSVWAPITGRITHIEQLGNYFQGDILTYFCVPHEIGQLCIFVMPSTHLYEMQQCQVVYTAVQQLIVHYAIVCTLNCIKHCTYTFFFLASFAQLQT